MRRVQWKVTVELEGNEMYRCQLVSGPDHCDVSSVVDDLPGAKEAAFVALLTAAHGLTPEPWMRAKLLAILGAFGLETPISTPWFHEGDAVPPMRLEPLPPDMLISPN